MATLLSRPCWPVDGQIQFWEEHYFRLMAAMRILRMSIPMTYTPEYLEQEILRTLESADLLASDAPGASAGGKRTRRFVHA